MAYDIEQVLINEANRIGPDIYRKTLNTSPWLKLVKKDVWPDEMGDSIKVLTYERSLPTNALSWNQISLDPATGLGTVGHGNNAVPSAQVIQFAQTLRSYNLTQTALESPKLSVNDLRFSLKRKEQLSNIFAILQENTSYAWQDRFRDEYVRLAQNKVVANIDAAGNLKSVTGESAAFAAPTGTAGAVNNNIPASILTQGMLDRCYMKLIRDGGGNNALGRENARPAFGVILSSEASRNLIQDSPDIRQDYRYSDKANELLAPLGIERSYAGFFHMVDDWGPRYNIVSGAWVRVLPYTAVATTQGTKWDINPAYETAGYEDSIVFHTDVFANLVPKPITAAGSNVTFDAVSYMGDFKWKNIQHAENNPDSTIGYFRAILSSGSKPVRPEWGFVIRHVRAGTSLNLLAPTVPTTVATSLTTGTITASE